MVMQVASAGNLSYGLEPAFSLRPGFAFERDAAVDLAGGLAARASRVKLVIALSALGLLASAVFPLAGVHGGQMVGAALGLISLVVLTQAFDALHRLKVQAAEPEDGRRPALAFDRRPLHSLRRGAR